MHDTTVVPRQQFGIFSSPLAWSLPLFVAFLLALSPALAKAEVPEILLDHERALELAAQATNAAFPNADTVYVDDHTYIEFREDGTYTERFEGYVKVLTEAGRREMSTLTSYFTLPYNVTEFVLVEIVRPDGTVVPVDIAANSQVMTEREQMEANIYNPNSKYLNVSIPGLEVGDTVHYLIHDEFQHPRVPGTFAEYTCFEGTAPILRSEMTVAGPESLPLQHVMLKSEIEDSVVHTEQRDNGLIIHNWVAEYVDQAFPEPEMPPFYTQCQRLMVSTIQDWEWLSRWYYDLSEPHIAAQTPEMEAKTRELVAGVDDPLDQIWAVFTWVSQEVRYLGLTVETESPGYEPHDASMTFDRRAGVCRDKAALLVAMLRIAGFEAFPVLINQGHQVDPDVPMVFFDHAITGARLADGSILLMDPTNESAAEFLPPYLNNKSYLIAMEQGDDLRVSPIEPPEQHMMSIATTGELTPEGGIAAETTLAFNGINDAIYRNYFASMTPTERRDFFEERLKDLVPGAVITSFSLSPANMLDTNEPLEATIAYTTPDMRIMGNEAVLMPIPHLGEGIGMARLLMGMMSLDERRYPIDTEFVCGVEETLTLDLGDSVGQVLSLPDYQTSETEAATLYRDMSVENNVLTAVDRFVLKLPEYSPEQYQELKDLARMSEANNRAMPIFAPGQANAPLPAEEIIPVDDPEPDAVILYDDTQVEIHDPHSWTLTRRVKIEVITYLGTDSYSEIAIDYNPVWEDVSINHARVTSPTGVVSDIEPHEINIMDAGWVGYAPRYPAAKTLVASLPSVEVGSTIDVEFERTRRDRPFFFLTGAWYEPDPQYPTWFLDMEGVFATFAPQGEHRLTISAPQGMDLNLDSSDTGFGLGDMWAGFNERLIHEEVRSENGRDVYVFTAENIPPVPSESLLPMAGSFLPTVLASSGSWPEYAELLRQTLLRAAEPDASIASSVERITTGLEGDEAIKAIHNHVMRTVRFVGPDLDELPLSEIWPASRTLADGYGNDADQAALLHAMLSSAGFSPSFVLAGWGPMLHELSDPYLNHPDPKLFTTVLVRVETEEGPVYLGDQDQYGELGATYYNGRPGLDLDSGEIITIRALSDEFVGHDRMEIDIVLEADGAALITSRMYYHGTELGEFRGDFTEMLPEERRREFLDMAASYGQSAEIQGEVTTKYEAHPGVRELTVRVPDFAVRQGEYLYMNLPGIVSGMYGAEGQTRFTPLLRDFLSRAERRVTVTLPRGVESVAVSPAAFLSLDIPRAGHIDLLTEILPGAGGAPSFLSVTQASRLRPVVVMPGEYSLFLEVDRILSHPSTTALCLRMAGDG